MPLLKNAGFYSLSSTIKNLFQTIQFWLLLQMHPKRYTNHIHNAALNTGRPASLPSSSSIPTGYQVNPPPVVTHNYTVSCVAINKSMKTFDGLDRKLTPEKYPQYLMKTWFSLWKNKFLIFYLIIKDTKQNWHNNSVHLVWNRFGPVFVTSWKLLLYPLTENSFL